MPEIQALMLDHFIYGTPSKGVQVLNCINASIP